MTVVFESDVRAGTLPVGDYRSTAEELLDLLRGPGWRADALCREYPQVRWFGNSERSATAAKEVCAKCLVRTECLAYALADPTLDGVWGGLTRKERSQRHRSPAAPDRLTA